MKKVDLDLVDHNSQSSIFIGENGGGKSSILQQLAEYYISQGKTVLAISNCLHDKFFITSKKIHYMSAKYGFEIYKYIFCSFFKKINLDAIPPLARAFIYCNYSIDIGFSVTWGAFDKNSRTGSNLRTIHEITKHNEIIWVPINNDLPNHNQLPLIQTFFENFDDAKNSKTIIDVNFFLKNRSGDVIPFNDISSGEASQISTLLFIGQNIDKNSVILIDEPENSLHPKWQREYINNIINVFYLYGATFFLSTHSPFIINSTSIVYEVDKFKINRRLPEKNNIEELLWDYFDIVTPENEFLSRYLTDILENYRDKKININDTLRHLKSIRQSCLDPTQICVVDDLYNMIDSGEFDHG